MELIFCPITYIPIRKEPSHRSEQVSQLIYGERATVIEKEKEWYFVKTHFDDYSGWLESKSVSKFKQTTYEIINYKSAILQINNSGNLYIPLGAQVSFDKNKQMLLEGNLFDIKLDDFLAVPDLVHIIMEFIGAPYLWGGRTIYGVDCSGFTQIVMKCMGIKLPRDASQQVLLGKEVSILKQARQGDLAFFENENGAVTHVGIVLKNNQIVHSSGLVRVDTLDEKGIYNKTAKKYTHKLHMVKTYR